LRRNPPALTGDRENDKATLAALEADGHETAARWGCPADGHASRALDPDLSDEAVIVARITETPTATTCPFARVMRADEWTRELTASVSLSEWTPLVDALGRVPTAADIAALDVLKRAQSASMRSDNEHRQREADARVKEAQRR